MHLGVESANVISKAGKNYIYLNVYELEYLIATICFVANHEENNSELVLQLEKLIDHLEKYFD